MQIFSLAARHFVEKAPLFGGETLDAEGADLVEHAVHLGRGVLLPRLLAGHRGPDLGGGVALPHRDRRHHGAALHRPLLPGPSAPGGVRARRGGGGPGWGRKGWPRGRPPRAAGGPTPPPTTAPARGRPRRGGRRASG